MQALGHPLSQILTGVVRLVAMPQYLPLRLRAVRMLTGLGRALGQRTHVAPLLLDMLTWKGLSQRGVRDGGGTPESPYVLRASKASLGSRAFQQDVVDQARGMHVGLVALL